MATVKKPKWKKATGTEGAISVKGGAYPVKGTGVAGGKVRGEVSSSIKTKEKRSITPTQTDGRKVYNTVATRRPKSVRTKARVTERFAGSMHRNIPKGSPKITDMKNIGKAKRPVTTGKKVAVAAVAAAAATAGTRKKKASKPSKWSDRNRVTGVTSSFDHTTQQWIKNK